MKINDKRSVILADQQAVTQLLTEAGARAAHYLATLDDRPVQPTRAAIDRLSELGGDLPSETTDPFTVLRLLDEIGSPATVASAGRRFFGFVIGGSLPVTVAANWLTTAWDQNAGLFVASPTAARLEEYALRWLLDLLHLPAEAAGAFVTGTSMAHVTGLAAARHALLRRQGWDAENDGLFGAPPIKVVLSAEAHTTLIKALAIVGFGRNNLIRVPVDNQGRLRLADLPPLDSSTLLCIQAGNVNSGAFDPVDELCDRARDAGAWAHVDGAFGLWAAVVPELAHLVKGAEKADSWSTDAHKWLNVPYDSGLLFCRDADALRAAMSAPAAYLPQQIAREPSHYTPELSRRARGVEVWAALRHLGRQGVTDLVERCCQYATVFADGLRAAGYEILNDVVLNQVLVSFGTPEVTQRVIKRIQEDGTAWCGGTVWQGRTAMRISVSSWATTGDDIERSLEAMLAAARQEIAGS
jgi:glutamate/tyrosine decarboxylase-like PLP-dependent enzyme